MWEHTWNMRKHEAAHAVNQKKKHDGKKKGEIKGGNETKENKE
jgi:hypothetical protein